MSEEKIIDMLLVASHFWLIIGIFSMILILQTITPIANFLFSNQWKWLVPILNLGMSAIGIFALNLTVVTSLGMKIIITLLITAITAYGYELAKPLLKKILGRFLKS